MMNFICSIVSTSQKSILLAMAMIRSVLPKTSSLRRILPPCSTVLSSRNTRKIFESGGQIAVVIPGRVFRNEDADATHEHTFYQCEGCFVSKDATMGQMFGVLKQFFENYYGQKLNIKTQPGYFPFTEPSAELLIERPASLGGEGWLEMLGCGMIHPNVLKMAGIDPEKYHGFAWGGGIDRLCDAEISAQRYPLFRIWQT